MFKDDYKRTLSGVRPSAEFDPEEIYMKANKKTTPMRRVVSVALAAALLLTLSLTAYATDLFGIKDFIMPDDYQSDFVIENESPDASTYQTIAISGYASSPEAKASAEWEAFYWDYTMNNVIPNDNVDGLPEQAGYYGAYNREMYDKLLEIADRYGLKLVDGFEGGKSESKIKDGENNSYYVYANGNFKEASYLKDGENNSYYAYANGNFKEEGDFVASDGMTIAYSLARHVKGYLSTITLDILDAGEWKSWNYTTSTGDVAAVGLSGDLTAKDGSSLGNRGLILVDLGDCFVSVLVTEWDEPIPESAMQELAENIDYARLAAIE